MERFGALWHVSQVTTVTGAIEFATLGITFDTNAEMIPSKNLLASTFKQQLVKVK